MKDIRLNDSPLRAGFVYYTAAIASLTLTSSMCVALSHASLVASRYLGYVEGEFLKYPDVLLRLEILPVLGAPAQMSYRFHMLARAGIPITSKLVASALLRSLLIYTALAAPASIGWLLGKQQMGHPNWWPLLFAFGGYWLARGLVETLLRYERPVAEGGRQVLSGADMKRFLPDK